MKSVIIVLFKEGFMKNIDYNYLCTVIGNLSGIPIRAYRGGERIFFYSTVELPSDPLTPYLEDVLGIESNVGYFITPLFHYYGVVSRPPYKIIIGPTRQTELNEQDIRELAFQCDVGTGDVEKFISSVKSIVPMPLASIIQILCTMNYVMNGEKLSLNDVMIYATEQEDIKKRLETERANSDFDADPDITKAQSGIHNTLSLEQSLVNIVSKGDVAALRQWMKNAPAVRGGTLASDQLRQIKNTFIVTATLISRAAIRGGMDANDALSLSDEYIQRCELCSSIDHITNIQYQMVFEYTERVERLRHGGSPSKLVIDVGNYVQHHLSEPISVERLAKSMFLSRTYLAAKFKKESGTTLTDFILREKVEEAKRLLRYTDKHATAIAAYLGFSSHSHFTNVFRKYTGTSPAEYRRLHGG